MKKNLVIAFLVGVIVSGLWPKLVEAVTVNPASNVTADTANTPGTLVLRDPSTGATSVTLQSSAIDTAKIAVGSIGTSKLQGMPSSVSNGSALCAKPDGNGSIGVCSTTPTNGVCTCI